jgi:hypothetical protein
MLNKTFQFGKIIECATPINATDLNTLIDTGKRAALIAPPSLEKIIAILASLGANWMDVKSPANALIQSHLVNAGIVSSSIELFFNEIAKFFSKEALEQRWRNAIGNRSAAPVGIVLHIGATNTLVAGLDGLVDGLLSGNVNFYKFSSPDGGIPGIFIDSLFAADEEKILVSRLAAFWWKGGEKDIEALFKANVDRIIVWGGVDAVMSWKTDLGYSAQVLSHGPKYGIGVLTTAGLQGAALEVLCKNIVMDVSMWDQKACNSLQALFVEDKIPAEQLQMFLDCLKLTFQAVYDDAPPVRTTDDYVDILSARELIKAEGIISDGVRLVCPVENSWSMALWTNWKSGLIPSPLCRFLHIVKFSDFSTILQGLKDEKYWMQTMAYGASESERAQLLNMARILGVTRLCSFGEMALASSVEPHDGSYDLAQLVNMMAN